MALNQLSDCYVRVRPVTYSYTRPLQSTILRGTTRLAPPPNGIEKLIGTIKQMFA